MRLRPALVAALIWVPGIQAQAFSQAVPVPVPPDLPNLATVGIGFVPEYEGADEHLFGALPAAQISFGNNRYIRLIGTDLSPNQFIGGVGIIYSWCNLNGDRATWTETRLRTSDATPQKRKGRAQSRGRSTFQSRTCLPFRATLL